MQVRWVDEPVGGFSARVRHIAKQSQCRADDRHQDDEYGRESSKRGNSTPCMHEHLHEGPLGRYFAHSPPRRNEISFLFAERDGDRKEVIPCLLVAPAEMERRARRLRLIEFGASSAFVTGPAVECPIWVQICR